MTTILDRLRGRTAPPAVKASTGGSGAGVLAYYNDMPLWSSARSPRKLMHQAQGLYHSHPWVHAAEQRVSMAAAGLPWHLEDDQQEEITDESAPELKAVRDLFEYPQALLPPGIKKIRRRPFWQVTYRHMGLCGNGFWYKDQRNGLTGIPAAFLYINPARMLAVYDRAGNTIGWKLDADDEGNGGVPLELSEVIQFEYDPADQGAYGIGIVEAAGMKAQLSDLADRQLGTVLASGGRLAGIIAPKSDQVTVSDDAWAQTITAYRNIVEDPNAAKRLQIVKAPIDYHRTVATPAELQIEAISKLSRDDVTSLWGVPLSQLGVEQPTGLNSGSTKSADEAIFYQGAVHSRVDPFREVIQGELDEIARLGGPSVQLVIDEPEYDDETPAFDRAQKALEQPLRNRERRAFLGLEPFGDPMLDEAIWVPSTITEIGLAPDADGKVPQPTPEQAAKLAEDQARKDAAAQAFAQPANPPVEQPPVGKASLDRWIPDVRKSVASVLREQARDVARRVREKGAHIRSKPSDTSAWWSDTAAEKALRAALEPHAASIAQSVVKQTRTKFPAKADFASTVADLVRESVGERITMINQTTREAIAKVIAQGFDDGLSPAEIGDLIEGATTFDEARAELIARTETALVYNESALRSFGEFGVDQVQAIDGDDDPECADRDGQVFSLAEAMSITDHPNGTLDWSPVV